MNCDVIVERARISAVLLSALSFWPESVHRNTAEQTEVWRKDEDSNAQRRGI